MQIFLKFADLGKNKTVRVFIIQDDNILQRICTTYRVMAVYMSGIVKHLHHKTAE